MNPLTQPSGDPSKLHKNFESAHHAHKSGPKSSKKMHSLPKKKPLCPQKTAKIERVRNDIPDHPKQPKPAKVSSPYTLPMLPPRLFPTPSWSPIQEISKLNLQGNESPSIELPPQETPDIIMVEMAGDSESETENVLINPHAPKLKINALNYDEAESGSAYEGKMGGLSNTKLALNLTPFELENTQKILTPTEKKWLRKVKALIKKAKIESDPHLERLRKPVSTKSGESGSGKSGSYFIPKLVLEGKNVDGTEVWKKEYIAVFKPREQELGMEYGGKDYAVARQGIARGDGVIREFWASVLLPDFGPRTVLIELESEEFCSDLGRSLSPIPKGDWVGALQVFVPNARDLNKLTEKQYEAEIGSFPWGWRGEELNPKENQGNLPAEEAHRLALGDFVLCNTDRNPGNILKQVDENGNIKLVPIDHGCILCAGFEDAVSLCWMKWPVIHTPISAENKRWALEQLDAQEERMEKIEHMLPHLKDSDDYQLIRETSQVWHAILREGLKANLTLYQMGSFLMFKSSSQSIAELIFNNAQERSQHNGEKFASVVQELTQDAVSKVREAYKQLDFDNDAKLTSTEIHSMLFRKLKPTQVDENGSL